MAEELRRHAGSKCATVMALPPLVRTIPHHGSHGLQNIRVSTIVFLQDFAQRAIRVFHAGVSSKFIVYTAHDSTPHPNSMSHHRYGW